MVTEEWSIVMGQRTSVVGQESDVMKHNHHDKMVVSIIVLRRKAPTMEVLEVFPGSGECYNSALAGEIFPHGYITALTGKVSLQSEAKEYHKVT